MNQSSQAMSASEVLEKAIESAASIKSIQIDSVNAVNESQETTNLKTIIVGDSFTVRFSIHSSGELDAGELLYHQGKAYFKDSSEDSWIDIGTSDSSWSIDNPLSQGLVKMPEPKSLIYGFNFDDLQKPRFTVESGEANERNMFHIRADLAASISEPGEDESLPLQIGGIADLWISRDNFHIHRVVLRRSISAEDTYIETVESEYSLFNEAVIEDLPKP